MTMLTLRVQIRTPDSVEPLRSKLIGNIDLPTLLAALHTLHALDAHPSPLGDPKAAIDFYEAAATAAQILFATNPVTRPRSTPTCRRSARSPISSDTKARSPVP